MSDGAIHRRIELDAPLALAATLAPLRHGLGDRTISLSPTEAWLAFRSAAGPVTLRIGVRITTPNATTLDVQAWGSGARHALETVGELVGEHDEPMRLVARHPVVRELQRRHAGLRLPRTGRVFDALVASVFEQKVTGTEAFRAYAALLRVAGEPAPGPARMVLHPRPEGLAAMPYHAFHPLGLERRRAEVIRHAARHAHWLDAAETPAEAAQRLARLPGVGPWTVAEVLRAAFGDADAVSVGDYHLPDSVAWALAREPRGDDARMLELLEPYRGQRGRVQRLLEVGRVTAPRFGPRTAPRLIAAL